MSCAAEVIDAVSVTGGHLGAGLGVVELTAAIHYVLIHLNDRLVWDVGHQCYPHKIITGRRDRIRTLRKGGGLSGFTKRSESEYDPFGAAHSSTSISAALGFAIANKLNDRPGRGIAVIGDGAMSAGMAYEAMNNAEAAGNRLVVILNDNDMSIAPPVGGLSAYLARIVSSREFLGIRQLARRVASKLPKALYDAARKTDEYARGMTMGGTLFEELGFYYVGPIDGHNMEHLIPVLENVRDAAEGPCLSMSLPKRAKATNMPKRRPTNIMALPNSMSCPASRTRALAADRQPIRMSWRNTGQDWPMTTPGFARSRRRCRPAPASTNLRRPIPTRHLTSE